MADRYSRQVLFAPIGPEGQERLRAARVGLVGLGALGSAVAEMTVRAGVGSLVAVDRDVIEESNLHRQGLYTTSDANARLPKAVAAAARLGEMNPDVDVVTHVADFDASNALEFFEDVDVIVDGTDGFEARYLINDVAVKLDRPWVYGACVAATGMTATIVPGKTPCLACLFPEPPPAGTQDTCDTAGIIAPAAAIVASLQVTEMLKLLVGDFERLRRGLLSLELWPFRLVEIGRGASPREDCRVCVGRRLDFLEGTRRSRTTTLCGRDSVQIVPAERTRLDLADLERRVRAVAETERNEHLLTIRSGGFEISVFPDGRSLVKGTTDPTEARAILGRFIGG